MSSSTSVLNIVYPNDIAYPVSETRFDQYGGSNIEFHQGLTKRETFAMNSNADDWKDASVELAQMIVGRELPEPPSIQFVEFWADFEAKIKVIKGAAVIRALNGRDSDYGQVLQ